MLHLDVTGVELGPNQEPVLVPTTSDEDYEVFLRCGLQFIRREKGADHEETLAHLAALAVQLKSIGRSAAAAEFQREHDALAAQLAAKK